MNGRCWLRLRMASLTVGALLAPVGLTSCDRGSGQVELHKQVEALTIENQRLMQSNESLQQTINRLREQVLNLQAFKDDSGALIFAPSKIVILGISRGSDFDGIPGDDGVTVHIRPLGADGQPVTVGGRITVQLLDNSDLSAPQIVGQMTLTDPEVIRSSWHGRFFLNEYVIKCPFSPDRSLVGLSHVLVTVEFADFLTGRGLRDSRVVPISPGQAIPEASDALSQ